jgi:hypothetical protein
MRSILYTCTNILYNEACLKNSATFYLNFMKSRDYIGPMSIESKFISFIRAMNILRKRTDTSSN